jgi:hypothetical protein
MAGGQKNFTALELFGSVNWGELHVNGPGEPFRAVKNAVSSGSVVFRHGSSLHRRAGKSSHAARDIPQEFRRLPQCIAVIRTLGGGIIVALLSDVRR